MNTGDKPIYIEQVMYANVLYIITFTYTYQKPSYCNYMHGIGPVAT